MDLHLFTDQTMVRNQFSPLTFNILTCLSIVCNQFAAIRHYN